jgi:membrane-associated phospholipid phosphatase
MSDAKQNSLSGRTISEASGLPALLAEWALPSRTMKRRLWPILLGVAYIAIIDVLGGLKGDHVLIGCLPLLDAYNEKTRLFLRYFSPLILTGVVYDAMRYFYWQGIEGHVHVAGPFYRDLRWFGVHDGAELVTPNEYFRRHPRMILDILCGFAYLVFVGEYLLSMFFLFFTRRFELLRLFGWSFFAVNVMGFITYFVYPSAPPWYVTQFGLGPALMHVQPNKGATARFDQIFGTHFFDQIYGRGVDVYGAYPSLHVVYPFLVAVLTFLTPGLRLFRLPAIGFYFLMCLSAVYLQHHWMEDILLGTAYAIITLVALSALFRKRDARAAECLEPEAGFAETLGLRRRTGQASERPAARTGSKR